MCYNYRLENLIAKVSGWTPTLLSEYSDICNCVFIPDGEEKTFSELGEKKNDISMRKIAFDAFNKHLEEGN